MYSQAEMIPPRTEQPGNAKVCLGTGHGWREIPSPQKRVYPYLLLPCQRFPHGIVDEKAWRRHSFCHRFPLLLIAGTWFYLFWVSKRQHQMCGAGECGREKRTTPSFPYDCPLLLLRRNPRW